jgi:hypothetical protein
MAGDLRAASSRSPSTRSVLRWSSWTSVMARRPRRSRSDLLTEQPRREQRVVQIRDHQDRYLRRQWNRQA